MPRTTDYHWSIEKQRNRHLMFEVQKIQNLSLIKIVKSSIYKKYFLFYVAERAIKTNWISRQNLPIRTFSS